jgi:hypothetical protein
MACKFFVRMADDADSLSSYRQGFKFSRSRRFDNCKLPAALAGRTAYDA